MKIVSLSPIFAVADLAQAMTFYRQHLGFELAWSWGAPPDIAAVCRDGIELMLSQREDAQARGPSHLSLEVTEVDRWYGALVAAGAEIVVPIADRPYGMRDFRVLDPSGNALSLGQPIEGPDHP